MATFFTADTHFTEKDFKGVITRDARPFSSCKQMNKKIIKIWNKQAGKNDTIYHLGDFVNFNCKDNESYKNCFKLVRKIKAKVILILGNNEERLVNSNFDGNFERFKEYLISEGFADVIMGGVPFVIKNKEDNTDLEVYMTHLPKNHKEGVLNLFGHIHSTVKIKPYGFNVGIDVNHFKLCSEEYILMLNHDKKYFDENVYK